MSDLDQFKQPFRNLLVLRQERDRTKAAAAKAEDAYREAEAVLFAELKEAGIRGGIEFDFGGDLGVAKFHRRSTPYGRVVDKETAIAALRKAGLEHIINEEAVRKGRLNELVKTRLETKEELPDGLDFYTQDRITISRK